MNGIGYILKEYDDELVPFSEAQPSPDGACRRCKRGWKSPPLFLRYRPALEKRRASASPGKREEPPPDEHPFGFAYAGGPARSGAPVVTPRIRLNYLQIRCRADTSPSIHCRGGKSCAA
jgi:hypothetical protein